MTSVCLHWDENDENEIIGIYGKRWNIEVFFKIYKSFLLVENREAQDERPLGELFLYFLDELVDIFINGIPAEIEAMLKAA